jgi:hypothetical protein
MYASFFVLSVLSGSTTFVESTTIPLEFRDALELYAAERDELVQRSNSEIKRRVLAQIQSTEANSRHLQTTSAPTSSPVCNAYDSVNFDDDFAQAAYADIFNPTCGCSEGTSSVSSPNGLPLW